jgi:putative peptidoglycan lipid II flippase
MGTTAKTIGSVAKVAFVRTSGIALSLLVSVLVASRFGASTQSDAFFFSRNIVMEFNEAARRVILTQAVPGFAEAARAGPDVFRRRVRRAVILALGLGVGVALALWLFSDRLVALLAVGFDDERKDIATKLLSILGLVIPAALAVAVIGGALNAHRKFGYAEIAMILPRVALVVALIALVSLAGVTALAWAMVAGIFAGLLLLIAVYRRDTFTAMPTPLAPPAASGCSLDRLMAVLAIQAFAQFSLWIDYGFLSSFAAGSVSVVEYGQRLMQILPGVVSASITTVVYTEFAAQDGERGAIPGVIARTVASGYFVVLPITAILAMLAPRIVDLLLGHGEFSLEAVATTAAMMRFFAPTVALGLISNLLFLALLADSSVRRARLLAPVLLGALAMRFGLLSWLTGAIGLPALPLVGAAVSLAVTLIVLISVRRYGAAFATRAFLGSMARLALACAAPVLVVGAPETFGIWPEPVSFLGRASVLVGLGALALAAYIGAAFALGVPEVSRLSGYLRRRITGAN